MSYVFISHDLAVVKYMADEVIVMNDGEIVETAGSDELYSNPRHPYTRQLLSAIPSGGAAWRCIPREGASADRGPRRAAGALPDAWAAHAYAQFGDIKYPPGSRTSNGSNPNAPKGGDIDARAAPAHHQLRQVQSVHPQGHRAAGLTALVFESLLTGTLDEPTTAYGLLAEDVEVAADRLSVTFRLNPRGALPRRHAGDGGRRQAQLRHADEQAGGAAVPRGLQRRQAAVVTGPRSVRFEFKTRERRAAADRRRAAGVQPRLGRRQALRSGGHGHADRERPLPRRARELRPRHHLRPRPRTTGRAT